MANATRLFQRWGIHDNLSVQATSHKSLMVRRFDGTKILAHEPYFQDKILSRYQAPFWRIHRVDLQRTLVARCEVIGVQIHRHSRVVFVDFDNAKVLRSSRPVARRSKEMGSGAQHGVNSLQIPVRQAHRGSGLSNCG